MATKATPRVTTTPVRLTDSATERGLSCAELVEGLGTCAVCNEPRSGYSLSNWEAIMT